MPKITSIKPQKSKKRVNIYLDGKFGFGLDLETFVMRNLKVEQDLSEGEIEKIVEEGNFQKSLDSLLKFSTLRPRSKKEIEDYLKRKKVHESLKDKLFGRLKDLNLVNDEKFATWWVEQRRQFRPKPRLVLVKELRLKGISKDVIDNVLAKMIIDEEKIARELLEKRKYRWKNMEKREARKKMSEFLSRKGFGWETIRKVVGIGDF